MGTPPAAASSMQVRRGPRPHGSLRAPPPDTSAAAPAGRDTVDTATYLAHAVASVREHGFVPARTIEKTPTWRTSLARLEAGAEPSPGDLHRAHEILGWAASLRPRDPQGYRTRLVACLAHERLAVEQLPLAASSVRSFNLHLYHEIRGRKSRERRDE